MILIKYCKFYTQAIGADACTDSVNARLPDTSLAFKLHLECGAMINVYDWMQAFISVLESSNADEADTKKLWWVKTLLFKHALKLNLCLL